MISEIEWVDFAAVIDGGIGVEMRVSSDGVLPNTTTPKTRQYTGDTASQVYDVLSSLAPEETQQAAS